MEKPAAYNFVRAEEEIARLRKKVGNLEIRCRIAEEDRDRAREDLGKRSNDIFLKILQRSWDIVSACEENGLDPDPQIDRFMACCDMAKELTGKSYDVDTDGIVYTVDAAS